MLPSTQTPQLPPIMQETDQELLSAAEQGLMRGTISVSAPNLTITESPNLKAKQVPVITNAVQKAVDDNL